MYFNIAFTFFMYYVVVIEIIREQQKMTIQIDIEKVEMLMACHRGEAVHCMNCGEFVMLCEAVYVDDFDDETACHEDCAQSAYEDEKLGSQYQQHNTMGM